MGRGNRSRGGLGIVGIIREDEGEEEEEDETEAL